MVKATRADRFATASAMVLILLMTASGAHAARDWSVGLDGRTDRSAVPSFRHSQYVSSSPATGIATHTQSYNRPAPWTPAWFGYCSSKYRFFNPGSGYFMASTGKQRFCR